jgi:hypothetical protein
LLGSLGFYVNGNINLGDTLFVYLTWHATRDPALKDAFERSLNFTLAPPQDRWSGFGLQYGKEPVRPDGSDGRGYLAEAGTGPPGFDPYYTTLQADRAALLYLVSRDPRAKRLLNLLTNTLLSRRTKTPPWFLDVSNGSRHPGPRGLAAFVSPAVAVAALAAGRRGLVPFVLPQLERSSVEFRASLSQHANQHAVIGRYAIALMAADG